ncbi:hypothetical protein Tco_1116776, partial [Tanacetum coccineum]
IMNTTKEQQKELDDALVALANYTLKLTPFYNAFEISADVPEIYMQEFWVTITRHHSSLHFKLDGKSHTVNVDNFRDMLKNLKNLHLKRIFYLLSEILDTLERIYQKSQENSQKNEQARTRERKSEQKPEAKPGKSSLSQIQSIYGQ